MPSVQKKKIKGKEVVQMIMKSTYQKQILFRSTKSTNEEKKAIV